MEYLKLILPEITLAIYLLALVAISFIIYMHYRTKQCKAVVKDITARLDRSRVDVTFFEKHVTPNIMKMHNPFTLRKPTIENYFTPYFINTYLHKTVTIIN